MKPVSWLVLAAFVMVWGGVLLDFGGASSPAGPGAGRAGAASDAATRARAGVTDRAAPGVKPQPQPQPTANAAGPPRPAAGVAVMAPPPGQGSVQVIGNAQPAAAKSAAKSAGGAKQVAATGVVDDSLLGEQGEGVLAPEFVELEGAYIGEPRDGPWALAEEQRLQALLRGSEVREQVALINCMETVCRIVLETNTNAAFEDLLGVRGIAEATGLHATSPYSLRAGQLSVYFKRPRR